MRVVNTPVRGIGKTTHGDAGARRRWKPTSRCGARLQQAMSEAAPARDRRAGVRDLTRQPVLKCAFRGSPINR